MTTARATTWAEHGVVCTPHYLASQAGLRVLQEGGNAVDAAIAANTMLNVVTPDSCHIGGDLFAIVWDPKSETLQGLNASGPAPLGATIDFVRAAGHDRMPPRGALTVTVPGVTAGWCALNERYGSWDLSRVFEQAISYARDGFPVTKRFVRSLTSDRGNWLGQDPGVASVFLSQGISSPGDRFRQPQLARTFERIGREGRDGFYQGPVAEDVVKTLRQFGSAMAHEDLATYEPEWVEPLRVKYRDFELVELPANSQGPTPLLMALIAEGLPVQELGHTTDKGVNVWVQIKQLAFADRNRYLGDPRFVDPHHHLFTDPNHAAELRDKIDMERTPVFSHPAETGDTIYLCVVDRDGLAVSLIQSLYAGFGSGILAAESGVLFQNRGYSFSLNPEHANALQPGKRPRHTLIPAMLLRDGVPEVVFGSMGGDGQAQIHFQLLLGMVDFELDPQEAIETPRWISTADEHDNPLLLVEARFPGDVVEGLRRRGNQVQVGDVWDSTMGWSQMIRIDRARGVLAGGADPRGDSLAAGW
jgi:gamma-glutamyltranspeptidase/glutathione hydrolase